MQLIGIVAFLAGVVVGFISLRALGWMVLVGSALIMFSEREVQASYAVSATVTYANMPPGSVIYISIADGSMQPAGAIAGNTVSGSGTTVISGSIFAQYNLCVQWTCHTGGTFSCAQAFGTGNISCSVDYNSCTGGAPAPTYSTGGCVTNNGAGIQGYYLHFANQDGTSSDWYSGPLAPGDYACNYRTNTQPFTVQLRQVFYNSDGGTNMVNDSNPSPAGTNTTTQSNYNPNGTPGGQGPIGPGAGTGSNTNLTGNQFANGLSNLISVTYGGNNVIQGQLGLGNQLLGQISSNTASTAGLGTNYDYRGYLIALTNQGSGHLTMLQTMTNQNGMLWTQMNQVALLSMTNFGWLTNELEYGGTNMMTINNPGASNQVASNSYAASNEFAVASYGKESAFLGGTNFSTATPPSPSSILDLPIRTNINNAGNWSLRFDNTAVFTQLAPWLRLLGAFTIFLFAVGYVHTRVQEETIKLGLVPQVAFSVEAYAGKVVGKIARLVVSATVFGSVPLAIGAAVTYFTTSWGGTPVSPLSDAGIANAGAFANAVSFGYSILTTVFPFTFACYTLIYLFFFDITVTGTVLWTQKAIKWTP